MMIDPDLRASIASTFGPLNNDPAGALPTVSTLKNELEQHVKPKKGKVSAKTLSVGVSPQVAKLFASASVDIWLRGVHSFLISASLTNASPIWSSVAGYYASHYAIRATAHLLGVFQLHGAGWVVRLQKASKGHLCEYSKKNGNEREHIVYWDRVKAHPLFARNVFYTRNPCHDDVSDIGHRSRANYADHLGNCVQFKSLDEEVLRQQVKRISRTELTTPPIPLLSRFPDVDAVQLIAYYRLVKFREVLDEVLGATSRFWNVHRDPPWANKVITFELVEIRGLSTFAR
jgi:hypothetical protein